MVTLGLLFFLCIFFMAMWLLVFIFTVVVPGSIKLALLNKVMPSLVERLAGDCMGDAE